MSEKSARYRALDHPIRRKIILYLAEEPQTYSRLLEKLEIESGHLAYHIRNLGELVEKDEKDRYYLNFEGEKAYEFLTGKKLYELDENPFQNTGFLLVLVLIVVVAGAILLTPQGFISERRIEEQKKETYDLSLQALDIVYAIFEDWEIPREHWTELLLKIVEIKSNLEDLYEYSGDERYRDYAEELEYFETELSEVIVVGDPGYMTLTVEKRHLIRELHTLLLEIEESLGL